MIVNKIYLENWGIVREPIEVGFSDRLNVLYGPNDIGKTTLIDSIRTVFFTKHTSHSEKVRSLIPWGSTLSPKATITFLKNGAHYRITKRFISSEMSLLEKLVDDKWQRIGEGDDADKRIIELIGGKLPIKGDTKPEFWGISQALWMVQGEPFVSEDLNEETLSSLQRLIGAAIESDQEKKIFKKVNEAFSNIFTGVRREIKKGSKLRNLEEKIGELEESKRKADSVREEKERLVGEIDDKEIILQKKKEKLEISLTEKKELEEKVKHAHDHKRHREKIEEEIKTINSEYKALREQIDNIRQGNKKIKDIELENHSVNERKSKYQITLKQLQRSIEKTGADINKMSNSIEVNDEILRYARIVYDTIQKNKELKEKELLLNEVEKSEAELLEKEGNAGKLKAPSKKEIKQIEHIYQQIHDLVTKLDTIGLATKIVAKSDISGRINLDEKSTEFKLKKGKRNTWTSHQRVKIEIDRIGDFEIKSGNEDIMKMTANLEEREIEYEKAVAPYGARDIERLKELSHEKGELEREIKRLQKELKKRAEEGKETIKKEIAGLKKKVKSNWRKIPEDSEFRKYARHKEKTTAQKELAKKIDELEKILRDQKREQKSIFSSLLKLDKEKEETKKEIQNLDNKIHGNSGRIKEIRINLENLQKDGLTIREREERLNQKSSQLDKKERAWKEYENEIEEIEEKPLKAWGECEIRIGKFREDISILEREIAEMNGELSKILCSLIDTNRIEEELGYVGKRKRQLLTEVRAIELLYDLMRFYRGKTIESLTNPIQKLITEDLRRLVGRKYGSIKFDEGIKPVLVEVSAWKADASIDLLSFGTKEQIWYLFRLALGRLLSKEERQLVVLDDPLANTDPGRMHHALQILKDNANELQIIVITCDVDKYNWLSNENFISFEK